jgi:hypothetical protein
MGHRRTRNRDYGVLVERSEFDPDAREELKHYHQIEREDGVSEISWSRGGKAIVKDKYPLPRKPQG